jgi:hypothetical protein
MQPGSGDGNATGPRDADRSIGRRTLVKGAGALALALGTVELAGRHAVLPRRVALRASTLPDIQFDIGRFLAAPHTVNDGGGSISVQMPPVHTVFVTARLNRTPTRADQRNLDRALATIEAAYAFAPQGIFTFVAYGIPYFRRLPDGLVSEHMPRLAADHRRFVLEEAVPGPTDVSPANPAITKQRFDVPVTIEGNDLLITVRSDSSAIITDVLAWLGGSNSLRGRRVPSPGLFKGLATVTSGRAQFVGASLPRTMAQAHGFSFAKQINWQSPMWMGFVDQHVNGSGPAAITTFAGNASARLTTARPGDYFDHGSIQHLSHVIEDLAQFYALPSATDAEGEPYTERVQYMFRSNPIPSTGHADQYRNGGGPAYLDNVFQGTGDAAANAQAKGTYQGEHRMGHLCALQRSSRAADGTPMHIRMDGPGLDSMDVPDGSAQPKLQFTAFVPTAEFFRVMRVNQASLDLVHRFGVADSDNGLERFLTATRRQNFLIPPRRHRAFPLVELAPLSKKRRTSEGLDQRPHGHVREAQAAEVEQRGLRVLQLQVLRAQRALDRLDREHRLQAGRVRVAHDERDVADAAGGRGRRDEPGDVGQGVTLERLPEHHVGIVDDGLADPGRGGDGAERGGCAQVELGERVRRSRRRWLRPDRERDRVGRRDHRQLVGHHVLREPDRADGVAVRDSGQPGDARVRRGLRGRRDVEPHAGLDVQRLAGAGVGDTVQVRHAVDGDVVLEAAAVEHRRADGGELDGLPEQVQLEEEPVRRREVRPGDQVEPGALPESGQVLQRPQVHRRGPLRGHRPVGGAGRRRPQRRP